MAETLLEQAREYIANSSKQAEHMKESVGSALGELADQSKRSFQRSREAARRLAADYSYTVKKYPLSSVTGALTTGLLVGGLLGWCLGRRR